MDVGGLGYRPVRLAYMMYFFSQRIIFFSHNKSTNSTSSHGLSAKRTGQGEARSVEERQQLLGLSTQAAACPSARNDEREWRAATDGKAAARQLLLVLQ